MRSLHSNVMMMVPVRCVYHTEESECIRTANRAEEAELKAKGGSQCYILHSDEPCAVQARRRT